MAADLDAVVALAHPRCLDAALEQARCVDRARRQISGENEGASHREEEHIPRLDTHGSFLAIDEEPATALHQGKELQLVRRGKADGPRAASGEAARQDGL